MATAASPSSPRLALVPPQGHQSLPSLLAGRPATQVGDLTVHRITPTHHGRTLLTLGHAAEYLVNSRRYSPGRVDHKSETEAVHILMRLSRDVFEDFAERRTLGRRLERWLTARAVRLLEVNWPVRQDGQF